MTSLERLFPDSDYRFHIAHDRGTPAEFFAPTAENHPLTAQRRRWFETAPQHYTCADDANLLEALHAVAQEWQPAVKAIPLSSGAPLAARLGASLEPDFVLLRKDAAGRHRIGAGAVCFPSHWSLPEKAGMTLNAVHDIVPGLNATAGTAIDRILEKLRPGTAVLRSNWGLQNGTELNDHPVRALPRLTAATPLANIHVRVEHQALTAIEGGGILFGIRIAHHQLCEFMQSPPLARGLARALRTMPEEMVRYKNIGPVRERIVRELEGS